MKINYPLFKRQTMHKTFSIACIIILCFHNLKAQNASDNNVNTLQSKWASDIDISAPLPEYPRPQMVREAWVNLNGLWDYTILDNHGDFPANYEGKILVPFAIESTLSGVKKRISENETLWYRRFFSVPKKWKGQRILLHFGAVDWEATVYVNGQKLGMHQGGYDPFSLDITDALKTTGPQELMISVWDPTSKGTQPRGKQVINPRGIWYTPVSGIWQTVWLEPVPEEAIASLKITPDIDKEQLIVKVLGEETLFRRL